MYNYYLIGNEGICLNLGKGIIDASSEMAGSICKTYYPAGIY